MSHSLAQGEATCDPNNMGHGDKAKVTFSWPCSLLTPVVFANMVSILRDSLLSVLQLFPMHCNVNIVSHLRWTRMTYIYINCLLKANIWVSSVLSTYMTFSTVSTPQITYMTFSPSVSTFVIEQLH